MKVLILGGTVFLGRALVRAAQEHGHEVTILSRGRSGSDPAGARVVRGDRGDDEGLRGLGDETYDVVVDTSRQAVSHVRRAVEELGGRAGRYVFTSTVSVYSDFSRHGITEQSPVHEPLWPSSPEEEDDLESYAALNVACERVVLETLGDRALVVRPGLIVGDHDPTDRFGYWPARMSKGGAVLAPGTPDRPVQLVDVHDVADFALRAAEDDRTGVYNVCGPASELTMGRLLQVCGEHLHGDPELVWVDDEFLTARELRPYVDLPLWIPEDPDWAGFSTVSAARAMGAGLTHRPLIETIDAAMRTERRSGLDRERRAGLSPDRERELLSEWRAGRR